MDLSVRKWGSAPEGSAAVPAAGTKGTQVSGIRPGPRITNTPPAYSAVHGAAAEDRLAWVAKAACRTVDPDELFVRGAAQRKAAVICRHCPVVLECAADALDNRVEFGVWGGMTERQRRALLKQHPEVTSWADFFAAQRKRRSAG
ncbi:transcriptional regulator WhiB4 [Mycolicibacillus koreensis]|nr:transcriptional regulator WhiB4 [Mycolicibacillus koreensis]